MHQHTNNLYCNNDTELLNVVNYIHSEACSTPKIVATYDSSLNSLQLGCLQITAVYSSFNEEIFLNATCIQYHKL